MNLIVKPQISGISLIIEKENNRFSSPNIVISSPNNIPDDMKKTIINT